MTRPTTDRRSLAIFLGALAAFSSGFVVVSRLTGASMIALGPAYMFSPMLAGIVTCVAANTSFERAGVRVDRGRLRWLAIAAIIPVVLVLAGTLLALSIPGVEFVPDADPLTGAGTEFDQAGEATGPSLPGWPLNLVIGTLVALVIGPTLNAVFAFGEEFGWRGVLLTELAPLGFWTASAVIGLLWGLWHAPIILEGYNYPNYPVVGVVVMTAACVAMSPIYTYVTLEARSVFAPTILHGTFNAVGSMMIVFAQGGSELVVNPVGATGIAAFGLVALVIVGSSVPTLEPDWVDGTTATRDEQSSSALES